VGSDADIVIFDPQAEITISASTHHMNIDYNAYEGMQVKGVTETVLSRGKVIIDKDAYRGTPGEGKFLKRSPFGWKF
jgi:dihydropyrimidinase